MKIYYLLTFIRWSGDEKGLSMEINLNESLPLKEIKDEYPEVMIYICV